MPIINQVVAGSGGGGAPASYRAFRVDNGVLKNSITTPWVPLPAGTTELSSYILYSAYKGTPANVLSGPIDMSSVIVVNPFSCAHTFSDCPGLTSVDLSSLTTFGGGTQHCEGMFRNCTGLLSFDLSSLTGITSQNATNTMFYGCVSLGVADLSSVKTIAAYGAISMFENCTGLVSADLSSFATTAGNNSCLSMFSGCSSLTSVDLSSLTTTTNGSLRSMFANTALNTLSFPSLKTTNNTTAFSNMLQGVSGCTVHFPSNMQTVIGSWSDVTAGFGGTNTTVLFDLPATNTLTGADSNTYSRNPKYDTATSLAWKVGAYGTTNFTPAYYTSGTTDPAVSDAIYSDAACTQSVTTITAIA